MRKVGGMAPRNKEWIIKRFGPQNFESNAYLLVKGEEAALIDATDLNDDMSRAIEGMGVRVTYLLLTHGSREAAEATPLVKQRFGGEVCMHAMDGSGLEERGHPMEADVFLRDNDSLQLQGSPIEVLHTPGHTYGSLCFYAKEAEVLFSGMALMKGGYGRIWGPDTMRLMMMSLRRLNNVIPPDATIYPGKGPETQIAREGWINCLRSM
jgi:glyoxylase-like metal-dependent hydrolase (beta-lactamase superfamily II)